MNRRIIWLLAAPLVLVLLVFTGCPPKRTIQGEWLNDDPASTSVTRLVIDQVSEDQTTVHAYAACKGGECDWGEQFVISDANPNTWWLMYTIYHFDDLDVTLYIDLDGDVLWVAAEYRYDESSDEDDFTTLESFYLDE